MRVLGILFIAAATVSAGAAMGGTIRYDDILAQTIEQFETIPAGELGQDRGGSVQELTIEPFPPGNYGPFAFDGFSFETGFPYVADVSDEPPCSAADQCLALFISPLYDVSVGTPDPPRVVVFSDFEPGTTSFGLRLSGNAPSISMVIQGGGGDASFLLEENDGAPGEMSFAFHDALGLRTIAVSGAGRFDDVVTSTLAPIPLPPAGAALLAALGSLALMRRRAV